MVDGHGEGGRGFEGVSGEEGMQVVSFGVVGKRGLVGVERWLALMS